MVRIGTAVEIRRMTTGTSIWRIGIITVDVAKITIIGYSLVCASEREYRVVVER